MKIKVNFGVFASFAFPSFFSHNFPSENVDCVREDIFTVRDINRILLREKPVFYRTVNI